MVTDKSVRGKARRYNTTKTVSSPSVSNKTLPLVKTLENPH